MLSARQIGLVQNSFAAVLPITDAAAGDFYGRLFALAPDTKHLFKHDMTEQGRKLFLTLATVVDALDRLDAVVPAARELAIRHVGYGVRERHYDIVGTALVSMLRGKIGPTFDRDTEAAWLAAYGVLTTIMLDAARHSA